MKKRAITKTPGAPALKTAPPAGLLDDVRAILREARRKAYAATNFIMVEAYWSIGRRIV